MHSLKKQPQLQKRLVFSSEHHRRTQFSCFTSSGSSGSIMGASSRRRDRTGDEDRRFSHSVRAVRSGPPSRNVRFSSLMLVWCFSSSSGVCSISWTNTTSRDSSVSQALVLLAQKLLIFYFYEMNALYFSLIFAFLGDIKIVFME